VAARGFERRRWSRNGDGSTVVARATAAHAGALRGAVVARDRRRVAGRRAAARRLEDGGGAAAGRRRRERLRQTEKEAEKKVGPDLFKILVFGG
jgi:hypothetical protein